VSGVEELDGRRRYIPFERLGARRQKERVVLPPHRQQGRLVPAKILLEGWMERDVALVITEQVELHLVGTKSGQVEIVERVAVRGDRRRVGNSVRVLPNGRFGRQKRA
jgi:hypothetical protein